MEINPKTVSHNFISFMPLNNLIKESMKELLLPVRPKIGLSCELAIVIAAALVKPHITGILIKSIRTPR